MSDTTFGRKFRLLQMIPAFPRMIDTTSLASQLSSEGHDVTTRTVQRMLESLEGEDVGLERVGESKPYRWRFASTARGGTVPGLAQPEALALLLVEKHLGELVPHAALQALKPQLDGARKAVEKTPVRRWLDRVRVFLRSQPQSRPQIEREVLAAVQQAMIHDRTLEVRYRKANGDAPKPYTLHPVGFVMRESVAYVVAMNGDFPDVRNYALHRMTSATVGEQKARKAPDGFDLDAYVADGEINWKLANEPIHLELAFYEGAERAVVEAPLSKDQQLKKDGDVTLVTATVPDTRVLRSWLLGFGAVVEVRKPRALREAMATSLRSAAERYAR
jgi:predicted DNA-binding transcriptional regulator YafY